MTGTGRPPDWTEEEVRVLQEHPTLADEALAARLPGRTAGDIAVARSFVDRHSSGGHVSRPSDLDAMRLRVREEQMRLLLQRERRGEDDQPEPVA